jgi:ABC-type phosphate/phosphonate transport system substrate-binding protein
MRKKAMAVLLATMSVIGACADASTDESAPGETSPDTTTTGAQEETLGQFEDEINRLSDAISSSESAQELSSAWDTLKVELAATVATLRSEGAVAQDDVEAALDAFQEELDSLDIEENVSSAWDDVRSHVEQLMN